jgi:hypothetical protein
MSHFLGRLRFQITYYHLRSGLREQLDDCPSDSGSGAGYDSDLPLQFEGFQYGHDFLLCLLRKYGLFQVPVIVMAKTVDSSVSK